MEDTKLKIDILPNKYRGFFTGKFKKEKALYLSGEIAGVCYNKEGFNALKDEKKEKTLKRINDTLNNGHHSVYDHVNISFNLQNIPKILAMTINNEHQYTTSEKSGRYTELNKNDTSIISYREVELYNKWLNIFKIKIKEKYGHIYKDFKIKTLAQENARYLITVFMPTQMIYTTSLRQINYIASWMQEYVDNSQNDFEKKLSPFMLNFIDELERLNVLEPGLMKNEKHRKLSLFGKDLDKKEEYYGDVYSTIYEGSFAQFAQAQRHRTINYKLELLEEKKYFIPPIIEDDEILTEEWINDIASLKDINPQGEIVRIHETGTYEAAILKWKERLCSAAQQEIMAHERDFALKYQRNLIESNHPLQYDIVNYTKGARCTFSDFECPRDCGFKEGKTLKRKI